MAVISLTPVRALRRPRRADPRALVGVCITLAALAGSVAYWTSTSDSRGVLVAAHDLPAGATLRAADLSVSYMRIDDGVFKAAVPAEALDSLVGRELAEPIHAQQVIARAQLADGGGLAPDQVAITVPAHSDSAAGGRIHTGDLVQVLVTVGDKGRGDVHTRLVVDRTRVFDVGRESAPGGGSSSSSGSDAERQARAAISSVTLAATPEQARQLAEARRMGELDVVLLPPSASQVTR
jgi:Flp pilus assembly protein CpaB